MNMKRSLSALRKQFYPILTEPKKHNLTEYDNHVGFGRLDLLKSEVEELERRLRAADRRKVGRKIKPPDA